MSHRSAKRRRGYTLMELVVSMSSATLLMTGLASALVIATTTFNLDTGTQSKTGAAAQVQADLMADLQHALSFSERTATAVTFTVPDRDGDTNPETIRYAWSGTLGDPLTYQYNGGTVVNLAEDVQSFDLSFLTRTMIPFNCSPPTFEEFTETSVGYNAFTVTVAKPAGTMEGDLLIAAVAVHKDNANNLDAPAGWTSVTGPHNEDHATLGVWWKIAGASESSSYTFDWYGGEDEEAYGWIMRFTGHDPDSPIEDSAYSLNGDSTSPASPAVTTTTENTLILRLGAFHNDDINTDDPGLSGHTAITMDGNSSISGGAGYVVQADIGSSGTSNFSQNVIQESATVTLAITGAGCNLPVEGSPQNVLFVVSNSGSPTSQEQLRIDQLTSWGYTVNLLTASSSQSSYDTAISNNDVAYVSEEVYSGDVGTKLKNSSIGVVSSETALMDDFGFTSSRAQPTLSTTDIVNNSHYITAEFSTGSLTLLSSPQPAFVMTGTLAGGLQTLSETYYDSADRPALAVLDTGASLYGGGTAAARRVQLPWGDSSFDFSALTSDGLTMLKRSLEWAGGVGDGGGSAGISVDSTTTGTVASYTSSGTVSHTTAGSDRLMLVGVSLGFDQGDSVNSITYNGANLSLVGKRYRSGAPGGMEIWSLVAPATGTHDVVVNMTDNNHRGAVIGVMTFDGVDQATPLGSFSSSDAQSTSPSTSVTSATGELVFGVLGADWNADLGLTPGAGQTEHWDIWDGDKAVGGGTTEAGAASVVTSWSYPTTIHWCAGGVSIKPK